MAKPKYAHVMSINLLIKTKTEDRPTKEEIKQALDKYLKDDPEFQDVEWIDTEEED